MRLTSAVICLVLGGTVLTSQALTLGRARGAAWIGQSLQMSIPVTLEPGQSPDGLCPEADVFYADTKVEAQRVQVSVDNGNLPDAVTLRIQTSTLIDEPVVTLYVRVGCNGKTARRYVLLADYASDIAPAPVPDMALSPRVDDAVTQTNTASASQSSPAPLPRKTKTAAPVRRTPAKVTPAKVSSAPSLAPAISDAPPAPAKGARLQLDPLETLSERVKTLEATTSTTPLKEMVQDSQRIQQLQNDVKALLDQAAKNEATMSALRQRLDQAESERITNIWTSALLALTVIAVMAGLTLWNRKTRVPAWRTQAEADAPAPRAAKQVRASAVELTEADPADDWSHHRHETIPGVTHRSPPAAANLVDLEPDEFVNSVSVSHPADTSDSDLMGFGEPGLLPPNFNRSALLDLTQQAEFFLTLGNANSAIEVLEKRIRENPDDCPTVYLQLLEIANQYGLKTDFRQFREEFHQRFNADVPEFALFRHEGKALEDYPDLLAHIAKIWPSAKVMEVIESCVRFNPQDKYATRFDLAAFRDLILLHGLVRYQTYHAAADSPPTRAAPTQSDEAEDAEHIALDL